MSWEVGKVYEVKAKSGNMVKRLCIATVDEKYIKEQEKLKSQNAFAPIFYKDGAVWLALSPPNRRRLSEAEKARREKEKRERRARWLKRLGLKEANE